MAAPATGNPLRQVRECFEEAVRAGAPLPDAMALATADRRGRPAVRYVLLKEIDDRGLVFYTNQRSRKGVELRSNPYAAMAFYWHATGKQVRCEGRVELLTAAAADSYWASRPRDSQLASMASKQSAPLISRAALLAEFKRLEKKYRGEEVPRPVHWIGYRLIADRIELWTRQEPRLHHREEYRRRGKSWERRLLQP